MAERPDELLPPSESWDTQGMIDALRRDVLGLDVGGVLLGSSSVEDVTSDGYSSRQFTHVIVPGDGENTTGWDDAHMPSAGPTWYAFGSDSHRDDVFVCGNDPSELMKKLRDMGYGRAVAYPNHKGKTEEEIRREHDDSNNAFDYRDLGGDY